MVVVRDVLCRVKSAVRVREEKKLQSCHGIDQHAGAGLRSQIGLPITV